MIGTAATKRRSALVVRGDFARFFCDRGAEGLWFNHFDLRAETQELTLG